MTEITPQAVYDKGRCAACQKEMLVFVGNNGSPMNPDGWCICLDCMTIMKIDPDAEFLLRVCTDTEVEVFKTKHPGTYVQMQACREVLARLEQGDSDAESSEKPRSIMEEFFADWAKKSLPQVIKNKKWQAVLKYVFMAGARSLADFQMHLGQTVQNDMLGKVALRELIQDVIAAYDHATLDLAELKKEEA